MPGRTSEKRSSTGRGGSRSVIALIEGHFVQGAHYCPAVVLDYCRLQ
jgi:hypothetical protein